MNGEEYKHQKDLQNRIAKLEKEANSKSASVDGYAHPLKVGLKRIDHVQGSNVEEWECPECKGHYFFGDFIKTKPLCNGDGTATAY